MIITDRLPSQVSRLFTDSRSVGVRPELNADTAFVALRTSLADGHNFVRRVYDMGVRTFVVDRVPEGDYPDAVFVLTDNTRRFLDDYAAERLSKFNGKQIVVTGSVGKTTAKEHLAAVLPDAVRSPRSWNSAVGVPLSIIENTSSPHKWMITEVGIDGPGQAAHMRKLLRPSIGILTRMTDEHDERFVSHRAKVREKIELVRDAEIICYEQSDPVVAEELACLEGVELRPYSDIAELFPGESPAVSTRFEVREAPMDCVLALDSYTNDPVSLTTSLDIARRRVAGRRLFVILGGVDDVTPYQSTLDRYGVERVITFADKEQVDEFLRTARRDEFSNAMILIKGSYAVDLESVVTFLDEARHDTQLEVNLDALVHNYNYYRSLLPRGTGIIGMVKASAYGIGALEVAKTLESRGAAYLAVAVVDEAVALRRAGIRMPIIVLNPITNNFEALFRYRLEPAVFTIDELNRIADEAAAHGVENVPVHVKFDTGMHRLGFLNDEIETLAVWLAAHPHVSVASVFSHLATADCPDLMDYTERQVRAFTEMTERFASLWPKPFKRHLLNTAGISQLGRTPAAFDMARLGLGLYGVSPLGNEESRRLRPVARLTSTVISLKHWPAGTPIGYGCKGVTARDSVIATVPIGYADGVDRRLGCGNARFAVNGVLCPTIGNICMDLFMLDVTDVPDVVVGDIVEIFGPQVRVETLAETLDTIPYEILTSISPRVRRTYFHR